MSFDYDDGARLTHLELSNGVDVFYDYDNADHVTAITYKHSNGTTLGDITYSYDAAGRRVSIGGSLASTVLPSTALSATYDAANRLTVLNSVNLTYDDNGNTTADGTNTYTWDARNRLDGISGGVSASFAYDALDRRVATTIASTTKRYLYDMLNLVQEQNSSGTPTAALLTGGIDQVFARQTSGGISIPLLDALGSAIAEATASQSLSTTYGYEPFGSTSVSGTVTGLKHQFTGRENDGTGLYYFRARYYNPSIGRFITQDPLGFAGGDNIYAYVNSDPLNLIDPLGLAPGDPYPTQDAAGIAAGCDINGQSIANNWEYSGTIYQLPDGNYTYTKPATKQLPNESSPFQSMPDPPIVPTAVYHTHGAYDPSMGAANFRHSREDRSFTDAVGKPNYMIDPNYEVKRYDPDHNGKGKGPVKNLGKCKCTN